MGLVRTYQEQGGGNFATATNIAVNEEITIDSVYLDDKSFDKAYIMVNGRRTNGEDIKVRLGTQNIARIIEVLGDDEATWLGNRVKCIGTQNYPGLGKTGLLWTGVKGTQQDKLPPASASQLPKGPPAKVEFRVKAWLIENQGIIGKDLTSEVYNDLILDTERVQFLIDNKVLYQNTDTDMPHLDAKAKKFL